MNLPRTRVLLVLIAGILLSAAGDPVQAEYVEGFSRTLLASSEGSYADNRGSKVESSWEYAQDGDQSVTWETAPVPRIAASEEVTFVWSVGLSRQEGPHELYLNDEPCLTFTTGWTSEPRTWEQGDCRLEFRPHCACVVSRAGVERGSCSTNMQTRISTPRLESWCCRRAGGC